MRKHTLLKYFGLAALALNLNATEIYTVDELILKSLETSPNLEISRAAHQASKSRYDSAFSGYLPRVDLHAAAGKAGMTDTFGGSGDMIDDNVIVGKLSAKQILYDFGKTGGSVDSSKFSADSYAMQTIQDISDKKRDVKEAYYNVLKAKSLIVVHKENVKLNEVQLYRSKKYFEAGIRTKIDVSDAKVSLIQAKLDLNKAEYNLKLSYATLDEVVGFEELEREYKIYSKELVLETLFESLKNYELSLKESILYAYENRAILKREDALVKASKAEVDQASSGYYPSLYVAADYTKQKVETFSQFTPEDQWQATLNLDWNIYEGGSTNAKKQEKVINQDIANSTLNDLKLRIKKGTTQAYINLYKSRDSVELSQSLVKVSSEKYDQASKRYENGLSDYIELQQARQGYIDAKSALVVDYYNYYIAVAYLDNAIGK